MKEKQIQLEATNELYRMGYVVWFPPEMYFNYSGENVQRDIFGVFDCVAIHTKFPKRQIFIQLTTIQHVSDRRKKILGFYALNGFALHNAYVWGYNERKAAFKKVRI